MMKTMNPKLARLSNQQIIRRGDQAVQSEQELAIAILDYLNEIEQRSLFLTEGYSSMWSYCTCRWKYSPSKAGRFIAAARCVKKFPAVRALLTARKITVCGVAMIARLLSKDNAGELLLEVSGKKYSEIEKIVASRRTAPRVRESVRPIGMAASAESGKRAAGDGGLFRAGEKPASGPGIRNGDHSQRGSERGREPVSGSVSTESGSSIKLADQRYEIRFSVNEEFVRKLEKAQAVCSKQWSVEAVLETALDELLDRRDPERKQARRERRKAGALQRTRRSVQERDQERTQGRLEKENGKTGRTVGEDLFPDERTGDEEKPATGIELPAKRRSRHIPAEIRDAVFTRDGGRCTYVGESGVQCEARAHLQIDHKLPYCRGGEHTIDNLRLACGKHNRLMAREMPLARDRAGKSGADSSQRWTGVP